MEELLKSFSDIFTCSHTEEFCGGTRTPREKLLNRGPNDNICGVGILFQADQTGALVVTNVVKGGPAYKCDRIFPGDILYEVDGTNVLQWPARHAGVRLLGPRGSEARLKFLRDGRVTEVQVVRDIIHAESQTDMRSSMLAPILDAPASAWHGGRAPGSGVGSEDSWAPRAQGWSVGGSQGVQAAQREEEGAPRGMDWFDTQRPPGFNPHYQSESAGYSGDVSGSAPARWAREYGAGGGERPLPRLGTFDSKASSVPSSASKYSRRSSQEGRSRQRRSSQEGGSRQRRSSQHSEEGGRERGERGLHRRSSQQSSEGFERRARRSSQEGEGGHHGARQRRSSQEGRDYRRRRGSQESQEGGARRRGSREGRHREERESRDGSYRSRERRRSKEGEREAGRRRSNEDAQEGEGWGGDEGESNPPWGEAQRGASAEEEGAGKGRGISFAPEVKGTMADRLGRTPSTRAAFEAYENETTVAGPDMPDSKALESWLAGQKKNKWAPWKGFVNK